MPERTDRSVSVPFFFTSLLSCAPENEPAPGPIKQSLAPFNSGMQALISAGMTLLFGVCQVTLGLTGNTGRVLRCVVFHGTTTRESMRS